MLALARSMKEIEALKQQYEDDAAFIQVLHQDAEKINEALKYYKWLERLIHSFETGDIYRFIPKEEEGS
ncbi:hypothetical protein D3C77_618820 [compost metagenome]